MRLKEILVVDDQQGIRLLLKEVFKKEGYTVHLAANGLDALRIVEEQQIDCVLLDMKIPGMDGLEILKHVKERHEHLPVMMMTAFGEQDLIDCAKSLGAERFFTKPFNIFDIRNEVKTILNNQNQQ